MILINYLATWALKWQLRFNVAKCTIMRFTRSLSPLVFSYNLPNNHSLSTSTQYSYFGILLDNKLSWSSHINYITTKANKTLNFLKRNL